MLHTSFFDVPSPDVNFKGSALPADPLEETKSCAVFRALFVCRVCVHARQMLLEVHEAPASADPLHADPPEDPLQAFSASDDESPEPSLPGYRVLWASAEEKEKAKRRKIGARKVREHRARGSGSD